MNQTKLESLLETLTGTAIGLVVAVLSQRFIFPLFDIHINYSTNFSIAAMFTVVSIARGYVVRRWCDKHLRKAIHAVATYFMR